MTISHIDIASLAAEWLAVAVTLIGLSSLVLQLTSFQNLFDEFHGHRGADWLGPWAEHPEEYRGSPYDSKSDECDKNSRKRSNAHDGWISLGGRKPRGPEIHATYGKGFCGLNDLHVSRKPVKKLTGKASWTAILAIFHPNSLPTVRSSFSADINACTPVTATKKGGKTSTVPICLDEPVIEVVVDSRRPEMSWKERLETSDLIHHRKKACTKITRTAFVTCLVLTNSYQLYKYSDASGLRAAYSGYSGTWQVHWPLGGWAEIEFFPLDSHDEGQEKHPLSFPRRVDKCILMLLGIIEHKDLGKLAFPEPKDEGSSVLKLLKRGYIAHGKSSHLFNMMGGNPYEVNHLYRETLQEDEEAAYAEKCLKLLVPTPELDLNRRTVKPWDKSQKSSFVYVPPYEEEVLATALDCLPWSPLGWSIHRGLQCLLVAFGKRVMKKYRRAFANTLKIAIEERGRELENQGWSSSIVREYMPDNSATSVMGGGGDSGDSVRIVTAAAQVRATRSEAELDETKFWRSWIGKKPLEQELEDTRELDEDAVIALTKFFVLEWSNELDHKLYEDLPLFMLVA